MTNTTYSFSEFVGALSPEQTVAQAVEVFCRERAYLLFSPKQVKLVDKDPAAYSRNLEQWWKGEKTITVYPNEMKLMSKVIRPAIMTLFSQNPTSLLIELSEFLLKFRTSPEVHRLSEHETLIFLKGNEAGAEWTEREALEAQLVSAKAMESETFKTAYENLVDWGVLETEGSKLRVTGKYRT